MSELIRKEVKPVEQIVERKIICDLCGCDAEAKLERGERVFENWNMPPKIFESWEGAPKFDDSDIGNSSFSFCDPVEIEYMQGVRYPDNGTLETMRIDLCPKCFRNKFLRWLVQEGGTIPEIEVTDY